MLSTLLPVDGDLFKDRKIGGILNAWWGYGFIVLDTFNSLMPPTSEELGRMGKWSRIEVEKFIFLKNSSTSVTPEPETLYWLSFACYIKIYILNLGLLQFSEPVYVQILKSPLTCHVTLEKIFSHGTLFLPGDTHMLSTYVPHMFHIGFSLTLSIYMPSLFISSPFSLQIWHDLRFGVSCSF